MLNIHWGPHAWVFLHSITFNYPDHPSDTDKQIYYDFFKSLQNILPCPKCKSHYQENFKNIPIQLQSRKDLIHWLINIHNEVNSQNHKKKVSFHEVEESYLYNYNYSISQHTQIESNQRYLLIIILISLLIYYTVYLR